MVLNGQRRILRCLSDNRHPENQEHHDKQTRLNVFNLFWTSGFILDGLHAAKLKL